MKILLVAPQSKDTVLGAIGNYCRRALMNLGYDIEIFDFRESRYSKNIFGQNLKRALKKIVDFPREQFSLIKSLENRSMNSALCQKVKQCRPDIMLVVLGDTIDIETVENIKKQKVITANWFLDTIIDPRRNRQNFIQQVAPHYDYFFIYDSPEVLQKMKIGAGCVKSIPLACDPSIHKNLNLTVQEKELYGSEVGFIGSLDTVREELLKTLTEFNLAIWGNWDRQLPQLSERYRKKHVYFEEAVKIYNASKINLDIHIFFNTGIKAFDINPRVYEATGCGAFTITNDSPYLGELYEIDKEIACYSNAEELKEKITYYLQHPAERSAIALKGQERAYRDHTYEKRLKKIISFIKNQDFS